MPQSIHEANHEKQQKSDSIELFCAFRFDYQLNERIKLSLKNLGCSWNRLNKAWLCSPQKEKAVTQLVEKEKLSYSKNSISMPKGMISNDPKIAGLETKLEILEEEVFVESDELLKAVYRYNSDLRPEDFATPPSGDSKSEAQQLVEEGFHQQWTALSKKREEIELLRKTLDHLRETSSEKIFDMAAPLDTADIIIQECFVHGNDRTLQYCSDTFWIWEGTKYTEQHINAIRKIIYEFLRNAKCYASDGKIKSFNPNKSKVDQVLDAIKSSCYQSHHPASGSIWLDQTIDSNPKFLISFQNGILDVGKWLENPAIPLIPHTPVLLNVNALAFNFETTGTPPKEWLAFLNQIWPGDIQAQETLQEWMGYCLTQDTSLQKILLVVGPPRSGKGTIGRILRELLGELNVAGPTLSSFANEFGLQPLLNKTLALVSDARLSGSNSVITERLLSISGEDALTINRKHLSSITTPLPTRLMIMTNEIPDMQDTTGALASRFIILTMKRSWLGNEDPLLFARLRQEFSGILLWALQGLARLKKRGRFIQPSSSSQVLEELEAIISPIRVFFRERCEFNSNKQITMGELFNEWQKWCQSTHYDRPGNPQSFGKALRKAFPHITTIRPQSGESRDRYYVGVGLVS